MVGLKNGGLAGALPFGSGGIPGRVIPILEEIERIIKTNRMRVIITGGGGFLGHQLCQKLLVRGTLTGESGVEEPIEEVILFDAQFHQALPQPTGSSTTPIRVEQFVGSVDSPDAVSAAVGTHRSTSIFHLASMVSGECEERFDDALRVNLDGGRNIFEAARERGSKTRVVFASSIACFGGDAMQEPCTDHTKLTPQTTYGMTKTICELLINDYTRKGFFDGRSARLPTVIIRPGKPNTAASSWASGMFREPLSGVACSLPVHRDQRHPMTGYRTVIDSLIALHELPSASIGRDRSIGFPAMSVTPHLAEQALREVAQEMNLSLGPIEDHPDSRIQGIVDQWPVAVDGSRALALGFPPVHSLQTIIRHYLEDFQS
jgi:nucleoside-diphosphate-sugar epimerase